jgi:hypothetical protein
MLETTPRTFDEMNRPVGGLDRPGAEAVADPTPWEWEETAEDERFPADTVLAMTPLAIGLPIALGLSMVSPLLAAPVYVVAFVIAAWGRPWVGLTMTMLGAAFQQELGLGLPVNVSIGEANLLLTGLVMLIDPSARKPRLFQGVIGVAVLMYLAVCLAASLLTWRGGAALVSIAQMTIYVVIAPAVAATAVRRPGDVLPGLWAIACIACLLSLAIVTIGSNYVFGLHKNGSGAIIALGVIAATHLLLHYWHDRSLRRVLIAGCCLLGFGLIWSLSRGAWLGAMVGVLIVLVSQQRVGLALRLCVIALPVAAAAWFALPEEQQAYAIGFEEERWNVRLRLESIEFAYENFQQAPLLGVGVGLRKQYDATNLFLSTLAETGVIGVAAFLFIFLAIVWTLYRVRRWVGPSHAWAAVASVGVGLAMSRFAHGMVDHYWSRGPLLAAWIGVGLLLHAAAQARVAATAELVDEAYDAIDREEARVDA